MARDHAKQKVIDDAFAQLSAEDQARVLALQEEWKREGGKVVERVAKEDPFFFVRIVACFCPKAVRDTLEDVFIDKGLTNADLRAMLDEAIRERKH